jgi:hypothetical protein
MTGIGPVAVRQPGVRDRAGDASERIRFSPNILPRYARLTKSLEALIPILYLKGISTSDFEEALSALVGADAPGLSASRPIGRPAIRLCGHNKYARGVAFRRASTSVESAAALSAQRS